jgi:hypothetical protein
MNDTSLVHVTDSNAPPPPAPLTPAEINAYLDYAGEALKARRAKLLVAFAATVATVPRIDDDEVLGDVAENIKMARALSSTAEDRRKDHKDPFLSGGRTVDDWFKRFLSPLAEAIAPVQALMNDYGARKLARERAIAEAGRVKAEAEAKRLAEIAAKKLDAGGDAREAMDRASDAARIADKAGAQADQRASGLTRARGDFGATASVRETWKWRVTDIKKVPRAYMMVDSDAVKEAGKADRDPSGRPLAVIPGIEWYADTKMGVR